MKRRWISLLLVALLFTILAMAGTIAETNDEIDLAIDYEEIDINTEPGDLDIPENGELDLGTTDIQNDSILLESNLDVDEHDFTDAPVSSNSFTDGDYDHDAFVIDDNGVLVEYKGKGGDVVIPDGVTSIGDNAFAWCYKLISVTIPKSVIEIGNSAFFDCKKLTNVTIPNGVIDIRDNAFLFCSKLTNISLPDSIISIGESAFMYCDSLTAIIIPGSVTSIGAGAFSGCDRLTGIEVSNKNAYYKSIDGILYGKKKGELICCPGTKETVKIPNGVSYIGKSAFDNCRYLSSITIPCSVKGIGEASFYNCDSLTSVSIPNGVRKIDEDSFQVCSNLKYVTISGSVKSICDGAFYDCPKLTDVNIHSKNVSIHDEAFGLSDPTFHIIKDSNAIKWAKKYGYKYDVFEEGLSEKSLKVKSGQTHQLTAYGYSSSEINWSSSNIKIATVKNGKVTAKKIGKCVIFANVKNGKTYKCKLTVTDPAALSAEKLTISTIDSAKIKLTGRLNRKVTWSTSDSNVVKITKSDSGSATIKAIKTGSATITAKIKGGNTLKCAVTVVNPLTIKEGWWDDDYDDLASWEVGVKFINHSNKKIIYVTFDILQYNNRGDRLESPYDYYYYNDDIAPHDYCYSSYQVNDDTRSVKFKIREVTFADKTTWKP